MLRLTYKLFLLFLGVLVIVPPGIIVYFLKRHDISARIAQFYFKYASFVMSLRVKVIGKPVTARPLLLVSNHISYMDIFALASSAPIIFTPKAEIGRWPIIGFLCKLMGCVFIERKKLKTNENISVMNDVLSRNIPVVLFAEGTTSDSLRILPIRSSMFKVVEDSHASPLPVHVQPVFLNYCKVHNLPMDTDTRHKIAWYGGMNLGPHIKRLVQLGPIEVEVKYLPVVEISHCNNRKELAQTIEEILNTEFHASY